MKKKYCISCLLAGAVAMFLITYSAATAADKVVVIPLSRDTGGVSTVTSAGQVWMDRNLGAHAVATSSDDPNAYGSLYQWGRLGDGHEYRESPTTNILSAENVPGHGNFINDTGGFPFDWRTTPNSSLWQGESGINNPCPAGFRLPTLPELGVERDAWGSKDATGAFASPLKLVVAGYRLYSIGIVFDAGVLGYYWSSTVYNVNSARYLYFSSDTVFMSSYGRANGLSVRCIKD